MCVVGLQFVLRLTEQCLKWCIHVETVLKHNLGRINSFSKHYGYLLFLSFHFDDFEVAGNVGDLELDTIINFTRRADDNVLVLALTYILCSNEHILADGQYFLMVNMCVI